jgi:adenine-specific DNA methylase
VRAWCADQVNEPITRAYGGYYFSPHQAKWIDVLRRTLPRSEPARTICLAALIAAASRCAAAPGHTAQPFRPTATGLPFLQTAWSKDLMSQTQTALMDLAGRFARKAGNAAISDANRAAAQLKERDLVFVDPPYSAVQYSRFYHVLETIAFGDCGSVSGAGRYPPPKLRPRSRYSLVSESLDAFEELLATIASRGARVVLTFPNHECSNGLSGESVRDIAAEHFYIRADQLDSNFSTLGGRSGAQGVVADRSARHAAEELVLVLEPK